MPFWMHFRVTLYKFSFPKITRKGNALFSHTKSVNPVDQTAARNVRKEITMKRFAVFAIAIVMSVLFTACSDKNSNVPAKQTTQTTTERESTQSTTKSTKENTTKTTQSTEKTTRESNTQATDTNNTNDISTEPAPYETDNDTGVDGTLFDEIGSDFDNLFEEGTKSH